LKTENVLNQAMYNNK